jgi:hypothetical protein
MCVHEWRTTAHLFHLNPAISPNIHRSLRTDIHPLLKEVNVAEGVEFSKLTLILHTVSNGNLKTYPISAAEFNK